MSGEHDPRYPLGKFDPSSVETSDGLRAAIENIAALPSRMREAVGGLNDAQLDTPYREGGWTVRQVVHHVADSHMNGYVRLKLALTEETPTIKPYAEARWAELRDTREVPVEVSLQILDGVHQRWVSLLRGMSDADFDRGYVHPEQQGMQSLRKATGIYGWHSLHHVAHVTTLRERMGW